MTDKPTTDVTVVRIYLTEAEHKLEKLMQLLHDSHKVRGVTAFRGITGFGQSGKIHSSSLLDLSLDLPVVVEFFDSPEKIARILPDINPFVKPGHLLSWSAQSNIQE